MASDLSTWLTTSPTPRLVLAAGACIGLLSIITSQWEQPSSRRKPRPISSRTTQNHPSIPSPLTTLSSAELAKLTYSPDLLPGGRTIATPYGNMRAYEWGPKDGRKICLLHGDATPAPIFSAIAYALVSKECRVLLIDLWGRGFSDTPLDCRFDARLFEAQIYSAICSSEIAWTGTESGKFSMVGFSMGGGISMDFASICPGLIEDVVLLGGAGLLTEWPGDYGSAVFQPGWIQRILPRWYLEKEVRKLLGYSGGAAVPEAAPEQASEGELKDKPFDAPGSVSQWIDHHEGIMHAFLDTIAHAPITNQHETWTKVFAGMGEGKGPSRILMVYGEDDSVIPGPVMLGELDKIPESKDKFEVKMVPGDHGFPVSSSKEVIAHLVEFWKL